MKVLGSGRRVLKDPLYWVPIKYKLTLTFILISIISLGVGGVVSYRTTKDALRDQILKDLLLTGQGRDIP